MIVRKTEYQVFAEEMYITVCHDDRAVEMTIDGQRLDMGSDPQTLRDLAQALTVASDELEILNDRRRLGEIAQCAN
jgi:hypothetical protein